HRHLHSFPTRRSSDLTNQLCDLWSHHIARPEFGIPAFVEWQIPAQMVSAPPRQGTEHPPDTPARLAVVQGLHILDADLLPGMAGDRKSTRLNSSHDQI